MANYERKEEEALNEILGTINRLDNTLSKIYDLDTQDTQKHAIKKWYEEMKAIHEIKRTLHKIEKYDNYDEKELEAFEKDFSELLK